ncbi:MAG: site-2 protease family protein [Desulfomicrobium escambiense]|nr:site-2 protease family protein [Desulfomicrobium escambiense]
MFGWAKPVPYNPYNLRHPKKGGLWISFAGPVANLLTAAAAVLVFRVLTPFGARITDLSALAKPLEGLSIVLLFTALINISLAVFNLIPVPPLDGSGILAGLLSGRAAAQYERLRPYGFLILLVVMYSGVLNLIFAPVQNLDPETFQLACPNPPPRSRSSKRRPPRRPPTRPTATRSVWTCSRARSTCSSSSSARRRSTSTTSPSPPSPADYLELPRAQDRDQPRPRGRIPVHRGRCSSTSSRRCSCPARPTWPRARTRAGSWSTASSSTRRSRPPARLLREREDVQILQWKRDFIPPLPGRERARAGRALAVRPGRVLLPDDEAPVGRRHPDHPRPRRLDRGQDEGARDAPPRPADVRLPRVSSRPTRPLEEALVSFFCILELVKSRVAVAVQDELFQTIRVWLRKDARRTGAHDRPRRPSSKPSSSSPRSR